MCYFITYKKILWFRPVIQPAWVVAERLYMGVFVAVRNVCVGSRCHFCCWFFSTTNRKLYGDQARYFEDEICDSLRHNKTGMVAMASAGPNLNASQVRGFKALIAWANALLYACVLTTTAFITSFTLPHVGRT